MNKAEADALSVKICQYLRQEYAKQRILLPDSMEAGVRRVISEHVGAQWDTAKRSFTIHRK